MPGALAAGPFPNMRLPGLSGSERSLSESWRSGRALVLIGHEECNTTQKTLRYVDRIHSRRAPEHGVVAVLQDDAHAAARLKRGLGLELPLLLESDPYPLAQALQLVTVPTLFLVSPDGEIQRVSQGWNRADLEAFAEAVGVAGALFDADEAVPARKPG